MRSCLLVLLLFFAFNCFSFPGYILLIGGGSEHSTPGSWNEHAYKWAVNNADNKKVAIIHYEDDGNGWYESYFVRKCGATYANSIVFDSKAEANTKAAYDTLVQYDMVFLRGGNQEQYYTTFNNTKIQEAIEDIYSGGGVIAGTSAGMAVLSEVFFTAARGTVHPGNCLNRPLADKITLRNDFINVLPGYITDIHVAKKGRLSRALAFLANWSYNHYILDGAIAVDDRTAFAIDTANIGHVFGTGAVRIISGDEESFSFNQGKLISDSVEVNQLLQGCTYNFSTEEITGFQQHISIANTQTKAGYTILASGGNKWVHNEQMIHDFVNIQGKNTAPVIIISEKITSTVREFKARLRNKVDAGVHVITLQGDNMSALDARKKLQRSEKILFVNNSAGSLNSFIEQKELGELLEKRIENDDAVLAFVGDDSRLAGKTVVRNYKEPGAAFYGKIKFSPGLELLNSTVIMPNTYLNKKNNANTQTAVPYSMVKDSLAYGVWLTTDNYVKYYTTGDKAYFTAGGKTPVMMAEFSGGPAGVASQTSYGYPDDDPRMIAGMKNMMIFTFDHSDSVRVDNFGYYR